MKNFKEFIEEAKTPRKHKWYETFMKQLKVLPDEPGEHNPKLYLASSNGTRRGFYSMAYYEEKGAVKNGEIVDFGKFSVEGGVTRVKGHTPRGNFWIIETKESWWYKRGKAWIHVSRARHGTPPFDY